MKQEPKVGLTTINWVLSIGGIIILSLFIILPPVFRTFIPKEVEKEPEPEVQLPIYTLTCAKENITSEDYTDKITYVFSYQNKLTKEYEKTTNRFYSDPEVYLNSKNYYGKLVTALNIITGYKYVTSLDDNSFIVDIIETYELESFESSMIVVPGDTDATPVDTPYLYNASIEDVESDLAGQGYTCLRNE